MVVHLCLTVPAGGPRIASLSGRLTVDTAFARVASASAAPNVPFVVNADSGGSVFVAGAAGRAMRAGTIVTLRLRLVHPGVLPRVEFRLTELNQANGMSEVTRASVRGLAPRCTGTRPAIFQVLPPEASADPGEPLDLRISGCGFSPTRNVVQFADLTVKNVRSTAGGTQIRVVMPKESRSASEVAPMQIGAGVYEVTVDNGRGVSNARRVTLR